MSIAVVTITHRAALIAVDSKLIGRPTSESADKLFLYDPTTVFFGVGNYGISSLFFYELTLKRKHQPVLEFKEAISELQEYQRVIESDVYLKNFRAIIGVLSFQYGKTSSAYVDIDGTRKHSLVYQMTNGTLAVFPPPDLEISQCVEFFKTNCPSNFGQLSANDLILPAVETIKQAALVSEYVNDQIQYYGYDHTLQEPVSYLRRHE